MVGTTHLIITSPNPQTIAYIKSKLNIKDFEKLILIAPQVNNHEPAILYSKNLSRIKLNSRLITLKHYVNYDEIKEQYIALIGNELLRIPRDSYVVVIGFHSVRVYNEVANLLLKLTSGCNALVVALANLCVSLDEEVTRNCLSKVVRSIKSLEYREIHGTYNDSHVINTAMYYLKSYLRRWGVSNPTIDVYEARVDSICSNECIYLAKYLISFNTHCNY